MLLLFLVSGARAADYTLEFSLGNAWSLEQPVSIRLDNGSSVDFDAKYETRGFDDPPYYSLRFGRWQKQRAWEVELIHHKLYVNDADLPGDVQKFEITDGFNILTVNHVWDLDVVNLRLGLGTVVAHPDITVQGQSTYERGGGAIPAFWSDGYQWGGYAVQLGLQKRYFLDKSSFISLESKLLHAETNIDLVNGSVDVKDQSLHLLFGYGYRF